MLSPSLVATLKKCLWVSGLDPIALTLELGGTEVDINLMEVIRVSEAIIALAPHIALPLFAVDRTHITNPFSLGIHMIRLDRELIGAMTKTSASIFYQVSSRSPTSCASGSLLTAWALTTWRNL